MKTPTTYDNSSVAHFLCGIVHCDELCSQYPEADDILTGVLALRTEGCNSTGSMSPRLLLSILSNCPEISVEAINRHTSGSKAERTCRAYAQLARVASRALTPLAAREAGNVPPWVLAERVAAAALNVAGFKTATYKGGATECSAGDSQSAWSPPPGGQLQA